ncbi:dynein light chain Tctex-type 5-B-like [Apostichopus japonicus]|uniref:dynein light chain Tctex-type 5-B-like n=1 Tax=Stichopus japonicus TaxID=307972 RepID=UPI003AB8C182
MASERDVARSKAARLLKRHGSASSLMSGSEIGVRYKPPGSIMSTISYMDEPRESRIEPPVSFEPTYQLGPEKHFPVTAVKSILKDVVGRHLDNRQYEPEFCKETTKAISEDVKSRVKLMKLGRYKIICLVHIGQLKDQGLHVTSRCLWDADSDNSSSFEYRNSTLFAVATVFGIYHE